MVIELTVFQQKRERPLVGAVADSGQLAKLSQASGVDFLLALNVGVFRGRGVIPQAAFLPFANGNDLTEALIQNEVMSAAGDLPVFAGLIVNDPTCPIEDRMLRLRGLGVAGVVNYPSVGLIDGNMRRIFESEGVTVGAEIEMLRQAKSDGFGAIGFSGAEPGEAAKFAAAGLDALILSPGPTHLLHDLRERRDRLQHAIRALNTALREVKEIAPELPCLVFGGPITAPEDLEQVYRQAPFDGFVGGSVFGRFPIESSVTAAIARFREVRVHPEGAGPSGLGPMIGTTDSMRSLFRLVERTAACDLNVCIEGESGVGKELVATHVHRLSSRSAGALVTINCGAIPESLLESELFGHERGAFTGADHRRVGKFELANGGTLFLDEVGDLSARGQVALLRAIQQREITRVGGNAAIPVNVRILSASNVPLARLVEANRFRADLYYRLNNLTITVPPLRERLDDIPLLVEPILKSLSLQMGRDLVGITPAFLEKLRAHAWSGNLRELQHVLAQTALLEDGPWLSGTMFSPRDSNGSERTEAKGSLVVEVERQARNRRSDEIGRALTAAMGNKSKAAAILGVSRKTLYAWIAEIDQPASR